MSKLLSISRLWPHFTRALHHHDTLLRACRPGNGVRHFVPMAVMRDESQAYKPKSISTAAPAQTQRA